MTTFVIMVRNIFDSVTTLNSVNIQLCSREKGLRK
jgi:hypothetical protein